MLLPSLFYFFSLYEGSFEKRVDLFLSKVHQKRPEDLEKLMQEDLVRLSIFLEYKFKGYKRLKKSYRKKLYIHAEAIKQDFFNFMRHNPSPLRTQKHTLHLPPELLEDEPFEFLMTILNYLKIGQTVIYREASTFEKLLRDPSQEALIGDCNQLVTLYAYLFATRFPIALLQVKLMPGHICLHYKGIDIETTQGVLSHYSDYTYLSPITELVAVNLLDIADPEEGQFEVKAPQMLQAAQFAYKFSSHRPTVEANLLLAYRNLAVFYLQKKRFKEATAFANKSGDSLLQKQIIRSEGVYYFHQKFYEKALEKFRKIHDLKAENACYQAELKDLYEKIRGLKNISDFQRHHATLKKMRELALKTSHSGTVEFVDKVMKQF